jgi:hypothetical protein
MQAVWMVRSKQLLNRFRFWLAMFGYNRNDRSLTHKIYLVYAAIFFMIWGFAVLSLLAGQMAGLLLATGVRPLPMAATAVSLLGLLVWWFIGLERASWRTPIPFSEEDAFLICQTPVSRRAVALAWFAGEWPAGALAFGAVAVTLGFSLVEAAAGGQLSGTDFPRYVLAGLRSLSLILPLFAGLMAAQWAWGVYRLHDYQKRRGLRFVPLGLAATLIAGWVAAQSQAVPRDALPNTSGNWLSSLVVSPWLAVLRPL